MGKAERLTAVLNEAFPADPDFPEIAFASDPQLMLDAFRSHLKPVAGRSWTIARCAPCHFRLRQSSARCILQYVLRVVDPDTGKERDQWATGLLYARNGEAEQQWQLLRAALAAEEIPERWRTFEPVSYIPDLRMLVQVFPFDRKLDNLRRVLRDGALDRLDSRVLQRLGPGGWRVEERALEPTRYRAELGAALRYTLLARDTRSGTSETVRCYLKIYRSSRGENTIALLQSLAEEAGTGRRGYAVVRPLAYLDELHTLVLEEAAGTSLLQLLLEGPDDPIGAVRAVARAVAGFNQDDVSVSRTQSLTDQLDDVRQAAALVQWACPQTKADVEAITDAVVAGLEDVPAVPIHGDLKPDHVFLSGDRVIFIDLDAVVRGDPTRDAAHLFAHLAGRLGLDGLPRDRARATATAFADEYFAHVPSTWRRGFRLQCAGALLEVARGIFKRQEPRWPEKVAAAVAEARAWILIDEAGRLADAAE